LFGGPLSRLLADIGLLFEVNVSEQMIFEERWDSDDMLWEDVELVFSRGSKTERPNL
jgi:hypothetical protein